VGYFVRERLDVHDQQQAAGIPDLDRHADPDADADSDRYRNSGTQSFRCCGNGWRESGAVR
jgi:hypothetical protein